MLFRSKYLQTRKITLQTAKELSIGSVNYEELKTELESKGINEEFYKKLGIDRNKLNENKMVLIIKDAHGRPCSFVSREMVLQLTKEQKQELKTKELEHGPFEDKEQKKEWVKQTFGTDFYRALLTPKYVNGIASLIYDKSKTFYGYSDVKKKINRFKYIITVEG